MPPKSKTAKAGAGEVKASADAAKTPEVELKEQGGAAAAETKEPETPAPVPATGVGGDPANGDQAVIVLATGQEMTLGTYQGNAELEIDLDGPVLVVLVAIHPIRRNGKDYAPGDPLLVTPDEVADLVGSGSAEVAGE